MPISLNYEQVRLLAKAIRKRIGRDVKHSTVLNSLAHAVGVSQDAMMHRLKTTPTASLTLDDDALVRLANALGDVDKNKINNWTLSFLCSAVIDPILVVDGSVPPISYFTFKTVEGKTRLFINHPGDAFQDYGFAIRNLMHAELAASALRFTNDHKNIVEHRNAYFDFEIDAPFTIKLTHVDLEPNRHKRSDTPTLDRLIHELTRMFSGTDGRYIAAGSIFRPALVAVNAETHISGTDFANQEDHTLLSDSAQGNTPEPWLYLQIFANSLLALQSASPGDWRNELPMRKRVISILKSNPLPGPIQVFANSLYTLHRAIGTLIDTYEILDLEIEDPRFDELKPVKRLIEEIILKDRQLARRGNEGARRELATLANRSIGMIKSLPDVLKDHKLHIAFDRGHWLDAIWEIMSNPGWDNFDDVAAYIRKNPMTAYNGYRQDNWLPD